MAKAREKPTTDCRLRHIISGPAREETTLSLAYTKRAVFVRFTQYCHSSPLRPGGPSLRLDRLNNQIVELGYWRHRTIYSSQRWNTNRQCPTDRYKAELLIWTHYRMLMISINYNREPSFSLASHWSHIWKEWFLIAAMDIPYICW